MTTAKEFSMSHITSLDDNRVMEQVRDIVPELSKDKHKGQAGRIGIVGGSKEYPGKIFLSLLRSLYDHFDVYRGTIFFCYVCA